MKMQTGPLGSQGRSSPLFVVCAGISLALGQTLSIKPINLPLPMFRNAERQNSGNRSWLIIAFLIPSFISSSSSSPLSKYFSMRLSSLLATASTSSLCNSSARAFSSSGMGNFSGLPPLSLNLYIVIRSTSMISWKPAPCCLGYCTTAILLPKCDFASLTVESKSAWSSSSLLTAKIIGVLNFSVYSQIMSVPTSTPIAAFNSITPVSATRSADITSPTKSSYPGVSRTFILYPRHLVWRSLLKIELPRSCSSSW